MRQMEVLSQPVRQLVVEGREKTKQRDPTVLVLRLERVASLLPGRSGFNI